MTQIWWVRHGPTHAKTMTGWRDIPADLSDTDAVKRLADHVPGDAIFGSSDLIRSIATADAIAGDRPRLPPSALLREFNFGRWDGLHYAQIAEEWPDLSRQFWETPGDITAPGGESWNDVSARASLYTDSILSSHPGKTIVLVAHFGIILTQVAQATGKTPYEALAQTINPLSVTQVDYSSGSPRLLLVNHNR